MIIFSKWTIDMSVALKDEMLIGKENKQQSTF